MRRAYDRVRKYQEDSLDAPLGDESDGDRKEGIMGLEDPAFENAGMAGSREVFLKTFKQRLFEKGPFTDNFKERAFNVFCSRFGFNSDEDSLVLQKIGDEHGVTRERIRQIEIKLIEFLKSQPDLLEMLKEFERE